MNETDRAAYTAKEISRWGYGYCPECTTMKYLRDLKPSGDGYACATCGCRKLVAPGWVECPQIGNTSVNCPVGGMGIVTEEARTFCNLYCSFRH